MLSILKAIYFWWPFLKLIYSWKATEQEPYLMPIFKNPPKLISSRTPCGSDGKESICNAGDLGSIPGSGRSPGGWRGNPLQCSCLENPVDRGAWRAIQSVVWQRVGQAQSKHRIVVLCSCFHYKEVYLQGFLPFFPPHAIFRRKINLSIITVYF